MISKNDENIINDIKKLIKKDISVNHIDVDWEKVQWIETLERIIHNLKIAKKSYKYCTEEEIKLNFYTAFCEQCKWFGSSKLLLGGGQIADTGDYSDSYCPVCGSTELDEID